jgi:hypothetical protein
VDLDNHGVAVDRTGKEVRCREWRHQSREVSFMAVASSADTMLTVNSPTSSTLASVSLSPSPPALALGAKPTTGGSAENALK